MYLLAAVEYIGIWFSSGRISGILAYYAVSGIRFLDNRANPILIHIHGTCILLRGRIPSLSRYGLAGYQSILAYNFWKLTMKNVVTLYDK